MNQPYLKIGWNCHSPPPSYVLSTLVLNLFHEADKLPIDIGWLVDLLQMAVQVRSSSFLRMRSTSEVARGGRG